MASSDEEGEILPQYVTDYYFQTLVNEQKELVSFSALPLQWSQGEVQGDHDTKVFLVGTAEDELPSLHKRIVAWKFDISYDQPQIAVLTKDENWIELLEPSKCFENIIRTTLITVHCLHFVKRNTETCGELVWNHLQKVFSSYEVQPSESDLLDQMQLIKKAAERDKDLEKSKYLISFMENPRKKEPIREVNEQKEHCFKVSDYYFQIFVNEQKELVSFSAMPLQCSEREVQGDRETQVFLVGTDGHQSLLQRVIAWKFEISDVQPQIAVLTENKNWIKLMDPRKCFENTIRTTLITVQCLHFLKRNPEACGELIWSHLQNIFSSYEVQPSESDLLDQMQLIKKTMEMDGDLEKSKYLISFMEDPREKDNEQKEHCFKASDYHFHTFNNEQKELVSFSAMPLQWSEGEEQVDCDTHVLLVGTAEDGLQRLIKQVVAWKFKITDVQPQIAVLTEDKNWIELLAPSKWFEDTIRTTLITVHCLHFVKRNPEACGELVWNHLQKVFSSYEVQPSESDLLDQMLLIKKAAERDRDLSKSEYLISFMENSREKEPIWVINEQKEHCSKASDYYFQIFVNEQKELVSFSAMPLQWSKGEEQGDCGSQVFLVGTAEDGLQSLREQVVAWKFEISYVQPQIAVLTKDKNWIELLDPRKWFGDTIRTTLITVHCLHFVKWNPEASGDIIWNHLQNVFSSYEVRPSESDLLDQMQLIKKAIEMDRDLEKSKYLISFMKNLSKKEPVGEDMQTTKKPDFINDDYKDKEDAAADEDIDDDDDDEEESNIFDTVCAICDNGGEVLGCQGSCMRSFHASKDTGDSLCETLGYSRAEVETMPNFLCKNCLHNQHQCFACGILGSSDISSSAEVFPCIAGGCGRFYHPECVAKQVFPCIAGGCGRFYHPECVAKLLCSEKDTEAELRAKIGAGEAFTCPSHKCFSCKEFENKNVCELQLAMCRRCPKSYHRKCLPKGISFEYSVECFPRAWDGLLPNNRILIYCLKHPIVVALGTPERNHLVFPESERRKRKYSSGLKLGRERVAPETSMVPKGYVTERSEVKMSKPFGIPGSGNEVCKSTKKVEKGFPGQDLNPLKKLKILDMTRKSLKDKSKLIPEKVSRFVTTDDSKVSLRKSSSSYNIRSHPVKSKHQNTVSSKNKSAISVKPILGITNSSRPLIDSKMQKRILSLMKDSTASFDVEAFKKRYGVQSNHTRSTRVLDKTLTEGKLEMSAKAVRAALQKIEGGGSIEDAKAICEPDLLRQMFKWKRKLNIYLTPFLYGKRYTSFGRHFTKLDKLKEIVDRLHWYVKDGDMIVDFCCGSNDFSCLMKEKLDKMGKRCLFKNYDLIQAKNDFSFEKRDWMSVNDEELPNGSRLIMGLNPPFGVHATLANKFIDKALQFKPKLLILIVPKETRRLDMKAPRYDLIWEDERLLSGKSFYLPGSVDVHEKQLEDWNLRPPPLYLWSRPDWTVEHKAVAEQRSHISKEQALHMENHLMMMGENHTRIRQIHHEAERGGTQTRFPGWREAGIATETPLNENDQPLGQSCYSQIFALPPPPLNENYQALEESCYPQNFPLPPPPPLNENDQPLKESCYSQNFALPPPPLDANDQFCLMPHTRAYFQTASLHYGGSTNLPSPAPPSPPLESLPLPPPPPLETYPFLPLPPPPPLENYPSPAPPSPPPPPPLPESYPSPPPSPPSSPSPNTFPSPTPSTPSPSTRIVYSLHH